MQPKKIVIENTVCLNTGDAAILIALIKIIKKSFGDDTQFSVFDSHPIVASKYYPEYSFYPLLTSSIRNNKSFKFAGISFKKPFIKLWRAIDFLILKIVAKQLIENPKQEKCNLINHQIFNCLKIYADADLIISTGGTYLVENYRLTERIEEFHKDIALKKPLILFTQSLGPFKNNKNIFQLKKIFNKAQIILLRDQRSKLHLQEIGVNLNNLSVVADSVFALSLNANVHEYTIRAPRKVAVSVREWAHFSHGDTKKGMNDYLTAISDAVIALVRQRKIEITFLSTCQGIPEYRFDDSKVANQIFESLPRDVQMFVKVDTNFHNPEQLINEINQFDFVIATRMHMAILSLCAQVPVLPIAYEFKTTELFKELDQEQWVTDISEINTSTYVKKVLKFTDEFNEIRNTIAPKILAQSESAKSAGQLILDSFKK